MKFKNEALKFEKFEIIAVTETRCEYKLIGLKNYHVISVEAIRRKAEESPVVASLLL